MRMIQWNGNLERGERGLVSGKKEESMVKLSNNARRCGVGVFLPSSVFYRR